MLGTIYIIKNTVNNKVYIGQTKQTVNKRFTSHMYCSKKTNTKFSKAIRELGKDKFYVETIEEKVQDEQLNEKEIFYINKYNSIENGYNTDIGGKGGEGGKRYDIPFEKIKKMYISGMTLKNIAKEFNCEKSAISQRLREKGIELRNWNEIQKPNITKEELKDLYINKFMTTPEMAKIYNTSHQTILKHLKKNKIPIRKKVNRKYLEPKITKEELYKLYEIEQKTLTEISKITNINYVTIIDYLDRYGIKRRKRKTSNYTTPSHSEMNE